MNRFFKGFVVFSLVALYLAVTTAPSNAAGKVHKWRLVTHSMVGTERYQTVVDFCETVNKASGGRLVIEPFGAGVLFPVYDSFDSVKNGIVQAGFVWSGYWSSKDPTFAVLGNRPGCPITDFSNEMYLEEQLMPIKEKLYKKYGVTYLGTLDLCRRRFYAQLSQSISYLISRERIFVPEESGLCSIKLSEQIQ